MNVYDHSLLISLMTARGALVSEQEVSEQPLQPPGELAAGEEFQKTGSQDRSGDRKDVQSLVLTDET